VPFRFELGTHPTRLAPDGRRIVFTASNLRPANLAISAQTELAHSSCDLIPVVASSTDSAPEAADSPRVLAPDERKTPGGVRAESLPKAG
jgi:hypothetical protein